MSYSWKKDWETTREHFIKWWRHEGLLVSNGFDYSPLAGQVHETRPQLVAKKQREAEYRDIEWRAEYMHQMLACSDFQLDSLPITCSDYGPGSLAMFLGSKPGFNDDTIWFNHTIEDMLEPETLPPLKFDPSNEWWQITIKTLQKSVELGRDKYIVSCPDLVENLDILASLRGSQNLLMDMIERPEWVKEKTAEINQVWFAAYQGIYDLIKADDSSSAFWAFGMWGTGTVAKIQCDISTMFSPAMFEEFAVPGLTEQCEWLDNSIFHLDGHQCIQHLEYILAIDELDAVEWTPDPMVPSGGSPEWYELYKRIKDAGKSVQAIGVKHHEIKPLLDAVGPDGLYICTDLNSEADAEKVAKIIEPYR